MIRGIHISELHKAIERGEFSMRFVAEGGNIVTVGKCVCTSFHSKGTTMNIKLCESGEVRTVRRITIIELNNKPLYI